MFDIITFGSATWDIFLRIKRSQILRNKKFATGRGLCFNLGSKVDVEDIYFSSGGGGTNTAATFAKQGFKTAWCGAVGDDISGRQIIEELNKLEIDSQFVLKTELKPTNHSVILNTGPKKDRTILVFRGASEELTPLEKSSLTGLSSKEIPWQLLRAKWFYLAPLSGKAAEITENIINFAFKNKIKIALNPGNSQLALPMATLERILKKVDVLFLNREEASLLTKIPYNKEKQIFKKLDEICPNIAIMGSSKGITVSDGKYLYEAKSSLVKTIDKTGAGDAFASGFVSGFIKKGDIEYGIQLGMANSSSCIQKWGAKNGLLKEGDEFEKVKIIKKRL